MVKNINQLICGEKHRFNTCMCMSLNGDLHSNFMENL